MEKLKRTRRKSLFGYCGKFIELKDSNDVDGDKIVPLAIVMSCGGFYED